SGGPRAAQFEFIADGRRHFGGAEADLVALLGYVGEGERHAPAAREEDPGALHRLACRGAWQPAQAEPHLARLEDLVEDEPPRRRRTHRNRAVGDDRAEVVRLLGAEV